jgi:hypothetical protein
MLTLNTGAPQGCVLSPVLFLLYTNALQWNTNQVFVEKYADDTVIVGLLKNDDDTEYFNCVDFVFSWCENNFLNLNSSKTKEILWDFRRTAHVVRPVSLNNTEIDVTTVYKYLGVMLDTKLSFRDHVVNVVKKSGSKLYCVRSMRKLNVNPEIIVMFYNATIPPALMYACTAMYGLLPNYLKEELDRTKRTCCKILGRGAVCSRLKQNDKVYEESVIRRADKIRSDSRHPLYEVLILFTAQWTKITCS